MASLVNYPNGLRTVVVIFIFCCALLPSQPVVLGLSNIDENFKQELLGSRPPLCVNKCLSCRPCMAILVIPPHQKSSTAQPEEENESYYLLSWKCRCGNKLFQP